MCKEYFVQATEGTDDDLYKKFEDKKKDETYDKDQLISQILRGGGKKSLR